MPQTFKPPSCDERLRFTRQTAKDTRDTSQRTSHDGVAPIEQKRRSTQERSPTNSRTADGPSLRPSGVL